MRWTFLHVILLALGWHLTNSLAWSFAFPAGGPRPRLPALFMCKLAGEAVNQLTPLANLGGEPLKAFLLRRQSPVSRGLASVVVNKAAQVFTGLLFTAVGLSMVLLYWELPLALPAPVRAGLGLLAAGAVLLLWLGYRSQRRMFSSLMGFARRCGLALDTIARGSGPGPRASTGRSPGSSGGAGAASASSCCSTPAAGSWAPARPSSSCAPSAPASTSRSPSSSPP